MRRTRWHRGVLACSLATAALAVPAAANAVTPGALGHEGRWMTDPQGRVVVLHGFNMVNKTPPFHATALGFGPDDWQLRHRVFAQDADCVAHRLRRMGVHQVGQLAGFPAQHIADRELVGRPVEAAAQEPV